jgi:hypothetical protein
VPSMRPQQTESVLPKQAHPIPPVIGLQGGLYMAAFGQFAEPQLFFPHSADGSQHWVNKNAM